MPTLRNIYLSCCNPTILTCTKCNLTRPKVKQKHTKNHPSPLIATISTTKKGGGIMPLTMLFETHQNLRIFA